jgi:E3 SUMO-protein ligase PIAS1
MASTVQQLAATITERSKTLINNDLKRICKEEGTSQTGNKATLQSRVIQRECGHSISRSFCWPFGPVLTSRSPVINNAVLRNDAEGLRRLQYRVQHHGEAPSSAASSSPAAPSYPQPPAPTANGYSMTNGYQSNASYSAYQQPHMPPRTPLILQH